MLLPNGSRSTGTPAKRIMAAFWLSAYGFCCLCGIGFMNFFICTGGRELLEEEEEAVLTGRVPVLLDEWNGSR